MFSTTRRFAFVVAAAFSMYVGSSAANALSINVNIFRTQTSGPQAGLFGPAGGLGEFWNQLSTSSATNLVDASSAPTSVGYTSINLGGPDTWGNPTLGVLRDGLRNFNTATGNTQQLTLNGLTPGQVLDVWLLSANLINPASSNQRSNGEWSTPNVTDTPGQHAANNTLNQNGTTFVEGNNFVFFDNVVVNASGQLVFNGFSINQSPTFDNRLPLNGFQIASNPVAAVPEPATASLALLGLGGLMMRRRRMA